MRQQGVRPIGRHDAAGRLVPASRLDELGLPTFVKATDGSGFTCVRKEHVLFWEEDTFLTCPSG
jgi:hypothetical protein